MRQMPKSCRSKWIIAIFSIFILVGDQISKFFIVHKMNIGDCFAVCPFFNIVRVENRGVSFGMLQNHFHPAIFIMFSFAVILFLLIWSTKNKNYIFPIAMIISGAIGNIIDRIYYGAVIDFLDFYISKYHWPAFNIADTFIVIGTGILFFISYMEEKKI